MSAIISDIAIVGAGPVGLTTALLLRQAGHSVTIFERQPKPYPMPRAVLLFHQAIRAYQSLDLLDELLSTKAVETFASSVSQSAEYVNSENEVVARFPVNIPVSKSGIPLSWALHQPTLESVLERVCLERGVKILRGSTVTSVVDTGPLVEVLVASDAISGASKAERYRAYFIVGCDGAKSVVRESSGIEFTIHAPEMSRWLVVDMIPAFDGAMQFWKGGNQGRQYIDYRRPRTSVPSSSLRRRWEFMLLPHEITEQVESDEFIWEQLQEFNCTPENGIIERRTIYSIAGCWAETFAKGRILLAGDAAHLAPQFLGQGVNSGLRDAMAVAWRLDVALKYPEADWPKFMADYSSEQLGTTKEFVRAAKSVESILIITDPDAAKKRDTMLRENAVGIPPLDKLGRPGMFLAASARVLPVDEPGSLFIHDKVQADGEERYLDEITGPGWVLVSAVERPTDLLDDETRSIFKSLCHGHTVDFASGGYEDISGRYSNWLRTNQAVAVLVRPDFYVYGVAKSAQEVQELVVSVIDRYECSTA